jgi:hypothetical protein
MFLTNKYSTWYYNIISQSKSRDNNQYTERHHIIPKSLGGSNHIDNIAILTAREHFICHWLLVKMTSGKERGKMVFALRMMKAKSSKHRRYESNITARVYESIKVEYSLFMSQTHSEKIPWNKGIKQTPEHNKKISMALKGKKHTEEHRKKNSESKKGRIGTFTNRTHSQKTKILLRDLNTGAQPVVTCPHCGKSGGRSNMSRYHFAKCKYLK